MKFILLYWLHGFSFNATLLSFFIFLAFLKAIWACSYLLLCFCFFFFVLWQSEKQPKWMWPALSDTSSQVKWGEISSEKFKPRLQQERTKEKCSRSRKVSMQNEFACWILVSTADDRAHTDTHKSLIKHTQDTHSFKFFEAKILIDFNAVAHFCLADF